MKNLVKLFLTMIIVASMAIVPVFAADNIGEAVITSGNLNGDVAVPFYNNVNSVTLTLAFDTNNTVYCGISATPYSHGTGLSGLLKLYDSSGTCLEMWHVSDYERPIIAEFTYPGVRKETYTVTFSGYAYGTGGSYPDLLDLTKTATCN